MKVPRFEIGKSVWVYLGGELVKRVVEKIKIEMTADEESVEYVLIEENFKKERWHICGRDFFIKEKEIFSSPDEFIYCINESIKN